MSTFFFFFKQKTAYEMRISDWSSDVCSSDLDLGRLARHRNIRENANPQTPLALDVARDRPPGRLDLARGEPIGLHRLQPVRAEIERGATLGIAVDPALEQIGRASCRERVCRYV